MSQPQPTRAEIYERIKASSKQEVILDEMQRLGFWPKGEGQPQLAAAHIQREGELQRELAELRQQIAVRQNPERALRQMRKERMPHDYEAHHVFDIWYRNTSDIVPTIRRGTSSA